MLSGFGIQGWRSFGPRQLIGPFTRINIFAGPNNAGKSTILRAVESVCALVSHRTPNAWGQGHEFKPTALNVHNGLTSQPMRVFLPLYMDAGGAHASAEQLCSPDIQNRNPMVICLEHILTDLATQQNSKDIWFQYDPTGQAAPTNPSIAEIVDRQASRFLVGAQSDWHDVWGMVTGSRGGGHEHWIPPVLNFISPLRYLDIPSVHKIGVFRRVGDPTSDYEGLDGQGLVRRLAALERPTFDRLSDKKIFQSINKFVQEVTEKSNAQLEIPDDKSAILVAIDGKTLPLESLGTGIHQVIILAVAATTIQDSVMCVEEPEIHLHPRLQKKLIRYLSEKTSNQYFISTHSANLLDASDASIFHVQLEDGATKVTLATTPTTMAAICIDLGYRASDLLQANCIIWVEGPSDRIYLNYWIAHLASELREGLDYSIMFYGGRLLSHLTANDPEVSDFISLRRLNRHISIVIDSDKKSKNTKINATKTRICEEFHKSGGLAWVTQGRELENYIDPAIVEKAIQQLYANASKLVSHDKYDHCYIYRDHRGKTVDTDIDKVKLARLICSQSPTTHPLDLTAKLNDLIGFIQSSNA